MQEEQNQQNMDAASTRARLSVTVHGCCSDLLHNICPQICISRWQWKGEICSVTSFGFYTYLNDVQNKGLCYVNSSFKGFLFFILFFFYTAIIVLGIFVLFSIKKIKEMSQYIFLGKKYIWFLVLFSGEKKLFLHAKRHDV